MIAVLTLLFGAVVSYWHALSKVDEEMDAAIAVGARIAANAVDDVEESADPVRRLHLLVADFDGDRHLQAIWQDSSGRPIVMSKPAEADDPAPLWFQDLIRQPEREVKVELPIAFHGLGRFVLRTESRNEVGEVWADILKTLAILGVLCTLVLAAVYWLVGRALRPLDILAVSLGRVYNSPDIPRIPETGPTELIQVYRGFNGMADRLQTIEEKNRRLGEQLETVQEEERADLARDLHDEIGPFLFSVDVDAASIDRCLKEGNHDAVAERVNAIRESVGHMQRHVKELLVRLRSAALVDMGLLDAVDNLVNFWRARSPQVSFTVSAPDRSFGDEIDQTVFRIVQEALSNAMRHGRPSQVEVSIEEEPGFLLVSVTNNGRSLSQESPASTGSGFGIAGMRERVTALGGRLQIYDRTDDRGVVVSARIPLDKTSSDTNNAQIDPPQAASQDLPQTLTRGTLTHEQA